MSTNGDLLELIGDMQGLLELDEFRLDLLHAVRRAVPADWVSLNDVGPDPDTYVVISDPVPSPEMVELFAKYAHQNPLIDYYAHTRNGRAMRFSDLITREQLHALELYRLVYKHLGVEYQLAFTLPHTRGRILGVALSRRDRDFTDAERDLLEQARPFLIQAYRNAIRYTAALKQPDQRALPPLERLLELGLTERQAEVLRLVATGASERDVARSFGISVRTVQKHLERCYRRLGVDSRSRAAAIAWSTFDPELPDGPNEVASR